MMPEPLALSVVMITLNEEAAITSVVKEIRDVIEPTEILIVDSSNDNTADLAAALGCRVIRQYPAQGYGPALALALKSAVGDVIITMDCDNTYPAGAIIELMQHIESGYDIVSASRILHRPKAMPPGNYIANVIFAQLAGVICGIKTTDVHTGMRAYRKSLLNDFKFDAEGMALPVELLIGPVSQGYKLKEIGIDYFERTGQSKLRPIQGTYWTLKRLWKWRRR
jgi:glycosyltransferase involved in cell wall biosynthesis